MVETLTSNAGVIRTTPEAIAAGIEAEKAILADRNSGIVDAFLDTAFHVQKPEEGISNVTTVHLQIGKQQSYLDKYNEAKAAEKRAEQIELANVSPLKEVKPTPEAKAVASGLEEPKVSVLLSNEAPAPRYVARAKDGRVLRVTDSLEEAKQYAFHDTDTIGEAARIEDRHAGQVHRVVSATDMKTGRRTASGLKTSDDPSIKVKGTKAPNALERVANKSNGAKGDFREPEAPKFKDYHSELAATIDAETHKGGSLFVRDIYDRLKSRNVYGGDFGKFREDIKALIDKKLIKGTKYSGKIPDRVPGKPIDSSRPAEEGNFAPWAHVNGGRDTGHGNSTLRNRFIDSTIQIRPGTARRSPVHVHVIEPNGMTDIKDPKLAPFAPPKKTPKAVTPRKVNSPEDLSTAIDDIRSKIPKRNQAAPGTDKRGSADFGSPYEDLPDTSAAFETTKGAKLDKALEALQARVDASIGLQKTDMGWFRRLEAQANRMTEEATVTTAGVKPVGTPLEAKAPAPLKSATPRHANMPDRVLDLLKRAKGNAKAEGVLRDFLNEVEDVKKAWEKLKVADKPFQENSKILEKFRYLEGRVQALEEAKAAKLKAKAPLAQAEARVVKVKKEAKTYETAQKADKIQQEVIAAKAEVGEIGLLKGSTLEETITALEKEHAKEFQAVKVIEAVPTTPPTLMEVPKGKTQVNIAMGKRDASLFKSQKEAAFWGVEVYGLKTGEFQVLRKGTRFYINIAKVVDETRGTVLDAMITPLNTSRSSLLNNLFGSWETADDYLSKLQSTNRHIATYGPQNLRARIKEVHESISKLPKKQKDDLEAILVINRDKEVRTAAGDYERGEFFDTVGQIERGFQKHLGKLPSDGQIAAYLDCVRVQDMELYLRNVSLHRDVTTMGLERMSLKTAAVIEDGSMVQRTSKPFAGKVLPELPYDQMEQHHSIFVYDKATGGTYTAFKDLTAADRARIKELVDNRGYKIIQMGNPIERPIMDLTGSADPVNFIVTKDFSAQRYKFDFIPKRAGPHVEYMDPYTVSQPKLRKSPDGSVSYEGDQHFINCESETRAKRFSAAAEKGRQLLKSGQKQALKEHLERTLPHDAGVFEKLFRAETLADGTVKAAKFDIDTPFTWRSFGANTLDMPHNSRFAEQFPEGFRNIVRDKFNLFSQINKEYMGHRDPNLMRVLDGTPEHPGFSFGNPRMVSPLKTANHAIASVARGRFLDDYASGAAKSFVEEFHDVLKQPLSELRSNPKYHTWNPEFDEMSPLRTKLAAAKNSQKAIKQLMNSLPDSMRDAHYIQQKIVDSVYERLGQKAGDWTSMHLLPFEKDPLSLARGFAFHVTLGLFAPMQFFMQAQSALHAMAIAGPRIGFAAFKDACLMRYNMVNGGDEFLRHMADISKKAGTTTKQDHYLESFVEMKKSGIFEIGAENSIRNDASFDTISTQWGRFLDAGSFPFNEGDRINRLTSWNCAYKEWRAANPTKAMSSMDRGSILNRMALMNLNMSNASSASWQKGLASVPTQFFAYNVHLAEQLLSHRITGAERARIVGMYSLMYGIPSGLTALTAYPLTDMIRTSFLNNGVQLSDGASQLAAEGIVSTGITMATGHHTNFPERYGPGGVKFFQEFLDGDKKPMELLLGVTGSTMANMYHPLDKLIGYAFDKTAPFPNVSDFMEVTKGVSSLNNIQKAWAAYNTQSYVTKNGIKVADNLTGGDAFMMGVFGLTPRNVTDAFLMMKANKDTLEAQKPFKHEFINQHRLAMKFYAEGDKPSGDRCLQKAKAQVIMGGFNDQQALGILKEAFAGNVTLYEKAAKTFINSAPSDQLRPRRDLIEQQKATNWR